MSKKVVMSDKRMGYFINRVRELKNDLDSRIKEAYPTAELDMRAMIIDGKGTLRSEETLRKIAAKKANSCNSGFAYCEVFDMGEQESETKAKNELLERERKRELDRVDRHCKKVQDAIHYGYEEELKPLMDTLSNWYVPQRVTVVKDGEKLALIKMDEI
jgi:hypothetical protein